MKKYPTDDTYDGEFLNDLYHGYRIYTWKNGNQYEEMWEKNRREGQWHLDQKHGQYFQANGVEHKMDKVLTLFIITMN